MAFKENRNISLRKNNNKKKHLFHFGLRTDNFFYQERSLKSKTQKFIGKLRFFVF